MVEVDPELPGSDLYSVSRWQFKYNGLALSYLPIIIKVVTHKNVVRFRCHI